MCGVRSNEASGLFWLFVHPVWPTHTVSLFVCRSASACPFFFLLTAFVLVYIYIDNCKCFFLLNCFLLTPLSLLLPFSLSVSGSQGFITVCGFFPSLNGSTGWKTLLPRCYGWGTVPFCPFETSVNEAQVCSSSFLSTGRSGVMVTWMDDFGSSHLSVFSSPCFLVFHLLLFLLSLCLLLFFLSQIIITSSTLI